MRVVALTCSNTEIVCALGCAGSLVGVDDHSDFPEDIVGKLPRVGPDLGVDAARVAALRPDLVLASLTVPGHERVLERLEREKLPFVATEPTRLEDVYADIRLVGRLLGVSARAEALVESMRDAMPPVPAGPPGPKVLVEWWPKPVIVPGRRSWVTDLIVLAGGTSPLGVEDVKSRPITDDEARALDPDAVVISWCGVPPRKYRRDVVLRRPAWQDVTALRNGRVHPVPEAYLGRPGPRLVQGYRALREIVEGARA